MIADHGAMLDEMDRLRRRLAEAQSEQARLDNWSNEVALRVPEHYEASEGAQEACIESWLDDQGKAVEELANLLREFEQAASPDEGTLPYAEATLDMEALVKLRELLNRIRPDLDTGEVEAIW